MLRRDGLRLVVLRRDGLRRVVLRRDGLRCVTTIPHVHLKDKRVRKNSEVILTILDFLCLVFTKGFAVKH